MWLRVRFLRFAQADGEYVVEIPSSMSDEPEDAFQHVLALPRAVRRRSR